MKRLVPVLGLLMVGLCFVGLPSSKADGDGNNSAGDTSVTFTKDVAPIFYKNCVECHRPGDIAPMSLLTYKDSRPWARSIREKVTTKDMPPWHADPHFGKFSNDRELTKKEIDTIAAWVDQGAKEGDPRFLPAQPNFIAGWQMGKPDVVLSMQEDYQIAANGPDEYVYFTLPTNFTEDKWIQASEIHPGNKRVVHHVIAFIQTPEMIEASKAALARRGGNLQGGAGSIFYQDGKLQRVKMDAPVSDNTCTDVGAAGRQGGQGELPLLAGYAPGKDQDLFPTGMAKKVPAGSNIVFQVHYSNFRSGDAQAEKDRTIIGLKFATERPREVISTMGVSNQKFLIPAGDGNHEVTACYTASKDIQIVDYMPHMHLRGKDMRYDIIYPDGKKDTLLWVPEFSFNWQTVYWLEHPLTVPKGSKIIVTAHFDNSTKNKYNPDPTKTVRWGDPTYDEMMIGWFDYITPTPKDRVLAKVDPKVFDSLAGKYAVGPMSFGITRDGDKLMVQLAGQPPFQLFPESESKYFLKVTDAEMTFVKNDKGEVVEVNVVMNDKPMRATPVKSVAASSK